jgi:fructosamine-3-kinase
MNSDGFEGVEFGNGNNKLDPAVLAGDENIKDGLIEFSSIIPLANDSAALPKGCTVVSTAAHGKSFWAKTGRIHVELADGTRQSFFIKVISNDTGRNMMHSEFESMKAIHGIVTDFAPQPVAWGTFRSDAKTHFYLCEFRGFGDEMPVPDDFTARLAKLHQNSQSPNGKFGFHVTTYAGNLPQLVGWESSWETFFAKSLRHALDLEIKAKGPDPELDALLPVLFNRVIPRLLRPLETNGRSVKPSLVHGDLWYANSGLDRVTGGSIIFDACCFYAHNECECLIRKQSKDKRA